MNDTAASVDALREAHLFSSFTTLELDAVIDHAATVACEAGDVVFNEGDEGSDLFLVMSGSVRVHRTTEAKLEQPIATLTQGGCLGEMGFLDGGRRSATAVATMPTRLLRLDHEAFDAVERQYPRSRAKLLASAVSLLSARLRDSNSDYWDFAQRSMRSHMEASQSQSRILSLVSHELRTPLTIIKSSAQLLHRGEKCEGSNFIEMILRQAEHLQCLIDDLITLSLLRTDSSAAEPTEFDAAEMITEIADAFFERALERQIHLCVARGSERSLVIGDPALLRGAVRHLVDNAVKFAPAESRVLLEVTAEDGEAKLSVQDEGDGLSSGALEHLSKSFVQSQDPLNRDVEGLGVGLSFVQEVIAAHGGTVMVDSAPGRGCRFSLVWPQPSLSRPQSALQAGSVHHG